MRAGYAACTHSQATLVVVNHALSDSVDRDRVLNLTQTEMASAMHVSGSTHPFNLSLDEPLDIVMKASRGERM